MDSQCNDLLKHLRQGRSITSRDAVTQLGITSLHRRLSDLKERGITISSEWVYVFSRRGKVKVKQYYIKTKQRAIQ